MADTAVPSLTPTVAKRLGCRPFRRSSFEAWDAPESGLRLDIAQVSSISGLQTASTSGRQGVAAATNMPVP
jgi:hypothetical protein